jgi:hypothetical protein
MSARAHIAFLASLLLGAALAAPALGGELLQGDHIAVRGFGTAGVACFSSEATLFTRDERPDGPGYDSDCDARLDSLLGLQLDASLGDQFEATLQATSYFRADGGFAPELTLANVRWLPSESLAVRLGRMQSAMFLVTEYRNIHYLQPWVRPPGEVYQLVTTYLHDGVEVTHFRRLGDWGLGMHAGLAHADYEVPPGYERHGTDTAEARFGYLGAELRRDAWLMKIGYTRGKASYSTAEIDALLDALRGYGQLLGQPGLVRLADDLSLDDKDVAIFAAGLRYEDDRWLFLAEYGFRRLDSFYRDTEGAYVSVGRRFGEWMPYATAARRWSSPSGVKNAVPAGLAPLDAYVDGLLASTNADRTTLALGLSRRLGEHASLKFQVDWIRPDADSTAPFGITVDAYRNSGERDSERLMSLNLDFVF